MGGQQHNHHRSLHSHLHNLPLNLPIHPRPHLDCRHRIPLQHLHVNRLLGQVFNLLRYRVHSQQVNQQDFQCYIHLRNLLLFQVHSRPDSLQIVPLCCRLVNHPLRHQVSQVINLQINQQVIHLLYLLDSRLLNHHLSPLHCRRLSQRCNQQVARLLNPLSYPRVVHHPNPPKDRQIIQRVNQRAHLPLGHLDSQHHSLLRNHLLVLPYDPHLNHPGCHPLNHHGSRVQGLRRSRYVTQQVYQQANHHANLVPRQQIQHLNHRCSQLCNLRQYHRRSPLPSQHINQPRSLVLSLLYNRLHVQL